MATELEARERSDQTESKLEEVLAPRSPSWKVTWCFESGDQAPGGHWGSPWGRCEEQLLPSCLRERKSRGNRGARWRQGPAGRSRGVTDRHAPTAGEQAAVAVTG